ncbi:MAG: metallophosphoesterase [Myxococcota bacterium]
MSHLIVGDGHFVGAPGEAEGWTQLLAHARAQGMTELSILGDFFELWIGLRGLEQPWHEALFAPLRKLKQDGVRLRYVVGNKDYFVREWNERHAVFDEVWTESGEIDSPLGRLHLEHGDVVNRADRPYRLWRAFSRSLPVRLLARVLPRPLLARLGERVATALQRTNRYHKSYFPREALLARGAALRHRAVVLVYGHFHEHHVLAIAGQQIVTLPFLGRELAGVWLSAAGVQRFDGRS